MSSSKPKGLGRGLSALMANVETNTDSKNTSSLLNSFSEVYVPIEKTYPLDQIKAAVKHSATYNRSGKIIIMPNG